MCDFGGPVSPINRKRGYFIPTTPAMTGPEWMPIFRATGMSRSSDWNSGTDSIIDTATCVRAFAWSARGSGTPALTKYTSPMVSTEQA